MITPNTMTENLGSQHRERAAYPVLSVEQAREQILTALRPVGGETVALMDLLGRTLYEDIVADMDVPPQDNSAMDGYAIRAADIAQATPSTPTKLRVVEDLAAGQIAQHPVSAGQAIRIMTGAPLPQGADTVVRFEDTHQVGHWVYLHCAVKPGRNVRYAGEDVTLGTVVVQHGSVIRPQEVGMLASVGKCQVEVARRPRVAILATGDELVPVGEFPGPGKIRNINSYSVAAQTLAYGGEPQMLGIACDQRQALVDKIRLALNSHADLIVTSGGVSAGDFDLVKEVLSSEGQMDFWWVNMKPGRPMAFGTIADTPLLALPGNPVSSMTSFALFGRPALLKMQGRTNIAWPSVLARLENPIERKDGRRHYLRVTLHESDDGWMARLTGDQGSGILTSMVKADGLAIIPEDCSSLASGSQVEVLLMR